MKYLTGILAILALLSCRTAKKAIERTTTIDKSTGQITDKSTSITVKEIDTTVVTKRNETSSSITAAEQEKKSDDDSVVTKTTKDGNITLETSYNKNTKEFKAKATKDADSIKVKAKETTTTNNNIVTNKQADIEKKEIKKDIQRESSFNVTKVLIWCGAILGAVLLIILLVKSPKIKSKKNE